MHSVAEYLAYLPSPESREVLQTALRSLHGGRGELGVCFVPTEADLREALSPPELPSLVVFSCGRLVPSDVVHLKTEYPDLPFLPWVSRAGTVSAVASLAQAGFREIVLDGKSASPSALERLLGRLLADPVSRQLLRIAPVTVAPHLARFVRALVVNTRTRTPVKASNAGKLYPGSTSTLQRHLKAHGFPTLGVLIQWLRLLHAASLLENPNRSVENVAFALGYSSRTALLNQLRRRAGLTSSEVRTLGMTGLVRRFASEMRPKTLNEELDWDSLLRFDVQRDILRLDNDHPGQV